MMDYNIKTCPKCGKNMIRKYMDITLTSYPPLFHWQWWCACGHEENGGVDVIMYPQELDRQRWLEANRMSATSFVVSRATMFE